MAKTSHQPARNRRRLQPGIPGQLVLPVFSLELFGSQTEPGRILVGAMIQNEFGGMPITLDAWTVGTQFPEEDFQVFRNAARIEATCVAVNPVELRFSCDFLLGEIEIWIRPGAKAFTSKQGFTCAGLWKQFRLN